VPLQRLSNVTAELQEGVMKTRMQPIGNAWQKLPRIVRDLAAELGKQIELEMHGADTELDRQVLDLIKDPLTHMVRNSADHGLETPAERQQNGKPELGTIRLSAYPEHRIERIKDTPVLRLPNKLLPLLHLKKLLKIDDGSSSDPENGFIVVTQVGNETFGIVVDGVFHTEEIVVKPMSTKLRHIGMFSGNTILGDGAVIMIIDPNGIAQSLGTAVIKGLATEVIDVGHFLPMAFADWFHRKEMRASSTAQSILLVDDSAFFRNMLAPVLKAAGYKVRVATNAQEGLVVLRSGQEFDAILTDIEMPDMNGFEFAETIRADTKLCGTPIIALSSMISPAAIERGR